MKEKVSITEVFTSFMKGVASIGGGLGPKNPYEGLKPEDADAKALRSDWEAVGKDISRATRKFQKLISTDPAEK